MYYIFFQVSESRISEPAISVNEIPSKKLKFSVNFAALVVWGAVEEASRRFQSLTFVQRAPVSSLTVFLYQIIMQHCFVCKGLTQDLISSLRSLFPYPSFQHSVSLLGDIPSIVLTYSWYFFRKIKNTCKLSPTIWQLIPFNRPQILWKVRFKSRKLARLEEFLYFRFSRADCSLGQQLSNEKKEMVVDVVFNRLHPKHYRKSHKIQSYSTRSRRKTIESVIQEFL